MNGRSKEGKKKEGERKTKQITSTFKKKGIKHTIFSLYFIVFSALFIYEYNSHTVIHSKRKQDIYLQKQRNKNEREGI